MLQKKDRRVQEEGQVKKKRLKGNKEGERRAYAAGDRRISSEQKD